jgi:hypothetical protein
MKKPKDKRVPWRDLLSLHGDLCGGAGALRQGAKDLNGAFFARPDLIMPSLAAVFVALGPLDELAKLDRTTFFDTLAAHVGALYAIHPFDEGNRRVFAAHATRIAQAAGYSITPCALDKTLWENALWHGFINLDHRGIARMLSGAPMPEDYGITAATGVSGIPLFPPRDAPAARRYLMSLAKARRELQHHLPDAREEALERLASLIGESAASSQIEAAQQELSLLRHAKGPMFQLAVLAETGFDPIEPCVKPGQSALERVREIAAAISIGINQQPRGIIEHAARAPHRPLYVPGASPYQDRLAAEFLANTAATNRADPRFAKAQAMVDDAATAAAADATRNPQAILAAANAARVEVARKIRLGELPPPLTVDEDGIVIAVPRVTSVSRTVNATARAA